MSRYCAPSGQIFIDGGSNEGESVDAFYRGTFHRCSLNQPNRLYPRSWHNASSAERGRRMLPLRSSADFCVRSFEANPKLTTKLAAREAELRGRGRDVRFIEGSLANATAASAPRTVYTYSKSASGSMATTFKFRQIHVTPPVLSEEDLLAPTYDVRDIIARALQYQPNAVIALKLDIEGGEFHLLDALTSSRDICRISYLFVEFHNLHGMARLHSNYIQTARRSRSPADRKIQRSLSLTRVHRSSRRYLAAPQSTSRTTACPRTVTSASAGACMRRWTRRGAGCRSTGETSGVRAAILRDVRFAFSVNPRECTAGPVGGVAWCTACATRRVRGEAHRELMGVLHFHAQAVSVPLPKVPIRVPCRAVPSEF